MNTETSFNLRTIKLGEKVKIKEIKDLTIKNYLAQVGIFIHQEIVVTKIAPFGSMIAVLANDAEIAIRKEVAEVIEVQSV